MAIRNIVKKGDEILTKKSKRIETVNLKITELLDDMAQTMYENNGVGLAAPQVGILKRLIVIDIGEGLIELINPEIIESSQEELLGEEGCLSVPGIVGKVNRPRYVKVKHEGSEYMARAFCHEIDHLEGILFTEKAENITYCD